MTGSNTKPTDEVADLSHHPTRKVDSMSSLVAEMLLRGSDADATSPGQPAVTEDGLVGSPNGEDSAAHDAVGLDMARLIEVRSSVAPHAPSVDRGASIGLAMRSKPHTAAWLLAALVFVATLATAAFALSRS